MKKVTCLMGALMLTVFALGCKQIKARSEIKEANNAYSKEDYPDALTHYTAAKKIDPKSFPELDRMIAYSHIGMYIPDDKSAGNEAHADQAIQLLSNYLRVKPNDRIARDALINTYLNANRTSQAIQYFLDYLKQHPADLEAVKSVATLYAKQGDFQNSLLWYEKITLLDSKNPESFYIFGVVCYEKVAKNPPADDGEKLAIIERGKQALQHAVDMRPDYAEAMAYLNLLWRNQAVIDAKTDLAKGQDDIKKADEIRSRAIEILKARKAGSTKKS